jgi:Domain of unknown function (DUF4139)/N-terminal domain of unknown function (DUF4140)
MEETIPKQSFHLKDLTTKCVTLYPSRAHVVREINDITLSPGQNEIEVYGLGPMVEENSIQIEGTGQATITDITVDLVPNRDDFFDVYPEDDEFSEDEMSEPEDSGDEIPTVKSISDQIKTIQQKIEEEEDAYNSAERQVTSLESYFNSVHEKEQAVEPQTLASSLQVYEKERERLYKIKTKSLNEAHKLQKEKAKLEFQKFKANKEERKRKQKLANERQKAKEKKERQRQEKRKENARVREERQKFWANKVYRVVVRLETAIDTPGPSRRSSLDSITLSKATPDSLDKIVPKRTSSMDISLTISYISNSLFWTPRYDLTISSLNKTATIVYRAELSNGTSETFKDTKVILSTSQTAYSGLDDKPPTMNPWHVTLHKAYVQNVDALLNVNVSKPSIEKETHMKSKRANMGWQHQANFASSFGQQAPAPAMVPQLTYVSLFNAESSTLTNSNSGAVLAPPGNQLQRQMVQQQGQLFDLDRGQNLNSLIQQSSSLSARASAFGAAPRPLRHAGGVGGALGGFGADVVEEEDDLGSDEGRGGLDFQESTWEDDGLTASYDLPGTRTLVPSSIARRHKVATLQAANVQLSHIAIPKLRTAAFLRAKIRNPSGSVTLLKGNAGVTLDGSFLGTISLQRVSPQQLFTIPLGVDPAIHINYPKPTVHRSTQGLFSKESAHVFSRSIYITNTKPMPIEILVLDQVPVSQEERLRIDILQPRGLSKEGDAVKTGLPMTETKAAWGKAVGTLKKAGEVSWMANIEKSQACILKFDYEARLPSSESVMTVA